uniref:Uncharacterized protein n=1 Tax=Branchiostoma floridae TaxID=7739 RepID=C3XWP8_BRAFL|eukprot:XP_002611148.1 hypothetical protein BRAFLDRAFT_88453 [Branchiostoma floridae]
MANRARWIILFLGDGGRGFGARPSPRLNNHLSQAAGTSTLSYYNLISTDGSQTISAFAKGTISFSKFHSAQRTVPSDLQNPAKCPTPATGVHTSPQGGVKEMVCLGTERDISSQEPRKAIKFNPSPVPEG